jgi:hypothetical protein
MKYVLPSSGGSKAKGGLDSAASRSLDLIVDQHLIVHPPHEKIELEEGRRSYGEAVLPTELCWLFLIGGEGCGVQWMLAWNQSTVASSFF